MRTDFTFIILKVIFLLIILGTIIKLLIHLFVAYIQYMFNTKSIWNGKLDKPRLFFYQVGAILFSFAYYMLIFKEKIFTTEYFSLSIFFILMFLTGITLCAITWTKKFETKYISEVKKLVTPNNNFQINLNIEQLTVIYTEFCRFDFIDERNNSLQSFITVLKDDFSTHGEVIRLNLTGADARVFYNLLKSNSTNLKMTSFFKDNPFMQDSNGNKYNYSTVKNAGQNNISKRSEELNSIFKSIKN